MAVSVSTQRAYASGVRQFKTFCCNSNLQYRKPSEKTLELFVVLCAQQLRLSPGTIKLYLCGIRHDCLVEGQGDVLKDTPHLDACLRGIKKVHTTTSRTRLALTTDIICAVGGILRFKQTDHMEAMLWAVLCVGFHGALRCGEFTVKGNFDGQVHLCRGDIRFQLDMTIHQNA